MLASVILVVHGHLPYVRRCVRHLEAHSDPVDYELLVIDNDRDLETTTCVRKLEERGVARHVVLNEDNVGYASGCNQGIRMAAGQWLVFLHTDCLVTAGWMDRLLGHTRHVQGGFRIGAIVPMTNYANEAFPIHDTDLRDKFIEFKLPNKSSPTEDEIDAVIRHTYPSGLDAYAESIRWRTPLVYSTDISSFCTAFSRDVFDECGFFDESYPYRGYEDKDMHMRMRDRGFEVWSARDCFVHHFGNITSDGDGFCFPDVMCNNKERFERVWAFDR